LVSFSSTIPLVHGDDERGALLPRIVGDLQVLHMHAVGRVHDEHAHVGPLDRPRGAQRRIEFEIVVHLAALAQACRVDEHQGAALVQERRVDRVPGGARLVGHHQSLAAQ